VTARTLTLLFFLTACSSGGGDGSATSMEGFVGPLDPTAPIAFANPISIEVWGRKDGEFPVSYYDESELPGTLAFKIKDLPRGESLVYRLSGTEISDTSTFPIPVDSGTILDLPAPPPGLLDNLYARLLATTSITRDTGKGTILGVIIPEALSGTACPFSRVELRNHEARELSGAYADGPYYFAANGQFATGFADPYCSFAFFNVVVGTSSTGTVGAQSYFVRYYHQTSYPEGLDVPVIALSNQLVVGYKIPRTY